MQSEFTFTKSFANSLSSSFWVSKSMYFRCWFAQRHQPYSNIFFPGRENAVRRFVFFFIEVDNGFRITVKKLLLLFQDLPAALEKHSKESAPGISGADFLQTKP